MSGTRVVPLLPVFPAATAASASAVLAMKPSSANRTPWAHFFAIGRPLLALSQPPHKVGDREGNYKRRVPRFALEALWKPQPPGFDPQRPAESRLRGAF